jgi:hypothetical protein
MSLKTNILVESIILAILLLLLVSKSNGVKKTYYAENDSRKGKFYSGLTKRVV